MTQHELHVADLIRKAFTGVVLGDGIGLWEAQGIDDYEDKKTIADYRAKDETGDWLRISVEVLDRCYSSPSFFDADGMRFHLPAFLIADLEGTAQTAGILFHLVHLPDGMESRFDLLSTDQRNAVREFLLLRLSDDNYEFERPRIESALRDYWSR